MARSNPPSRVFPINKDENVAKVMRTWILTLPPTMLIDASSAINICMLVNVATRPLPGSDSKCSIETRGRSFHSL